MDVTDRRAVRSRRNIRRAFVHLAGRKDLRHITVTEISRLADIDRKTFYAHYGSVDEVYEDLLAEIGAQLRRLLDESDDLAHLFEGLNALLEHERDFYRVIARRDSYAFLVEECTQILADRLLERRPTPPTVADTVHTRFVAAGIIGVYVTWLRDGNGVELHDVVAALEQAVQRVGLVPD